MTQDLRYALRQLRGEPIFTLATAFTLAAGIGANTAVFSLLYQTLLRTLPVRDPQQLVELRFSGHAPGHTHSEGNGAGSPSGFAFYVRTLMPPDAAMNLIRETIHNSDPKLALANLRTMDSQLDDTLTTERVIARLASSFGLLATVLAAIGLYGVLAYVTTQRTREIGIRIAVGARPLEVAILVLREVLILIGISLVFAIPASLLLGGALRSLLFNVSAADALTYSLSIAIITAVALLAAALPAHSAARVDPMQALRAE